MSKRLICTERPLAALGREDVMKRVFFFFSSVGRNLLLGWCWWVFRGFRGWMWPVEQLQHQAPLLHTTPQALILLTGPLKRFVIYLVSHKRERHIRSLQAWTKCERDEGYGDIMRGRAQGPACCVHSAVCRDDQQATDVVLSLCSAVWKGESLSAACIQGWGLTRLRGLAKP